MPHFYTEDELVEQPAVQLFAELGWQSVSVRDEVFGVPGTLGRETKSEVVLAGRLRTTLQRLKPHLPEEAITLALNEITRDRSTKAPVAANRDIYDLLKDGVMVSIPDRKHGGQMTERVRIIDWQDPLANDFLLGQPILCNRNPYKPPAARVIGLNTQSPSERSRLACLH